MSVAVVIPVHPPRITSGLLTRALASVYAQTQPPDEIHIALDLHREGAAATRQRGVEAVRADWTAFLDSDDEFLPSHLEKLSYYAAATDADLVYSWFETVPAGCDPFPAWYLTEPWDPANPRHTTMTVMVRTEIVRDIGFVIPPPGAQYSNEDWHFTLACVERGIKIAHLPERTWLWHHDSGNTSGLPSRW